MFPSRRVLSFGLRMTLKHLQDNVTSMQSMRKPAILSIQQNDFSTTKKFFAEINKKLATEGEASQEGTKQELAKLEGKLQISFTCKKCDTRNIKIISKHAYTKGVVIITCDGCKNNHLIADNLQWFDGTNRNIESILKKKGENVRRIRNYDEGYFEAIANEEIQRVQRLMKQEELTQDVKLVEEAEEVVKIKYKKVSELNKN